MPPRKSKGEERFGRTWPQIRRSLLDLTGVVGVFRGDALRNGRWREEDAICVHVECKLDSGDIPPAERIPARIGGHRTDILSVGAATVHAGTLDTRDTVVALYDHSHRRSTLTAVASTPGGTVALGSGHGLLPAAPSRYATGPFDLGVCVVASFDEVEALHGSVVGGRVGGPVDFAEVRFSTKRIVSGHWHVPAPIPWRKARPKRHTGVYHRSNWRGGVTGYVHQDVGIVELHTAGLGDQWRTVYSQVFAVRAHRGHFSAPGDSGSLVLDAEGRKAVGVIVGGSASLNVSYVLPIGQLVGSLSPQQRYFE